MSLPKPYYDHAGITIYHGDCREILPHLPKVDLVLTDPPYGIGDIWSGGSAKHGWGKSNIGRELRNEWDAERACPSILTTCREIAKNTVIWGGNYFADTLPATRGWLIWNKPERGFSLAEAELAWTDKDMVVRVYDCRRSDPDREHPTQKPTALMIWCLGFFPNAQTILDPFMGSGTTLVAAKLLGRKAIGIEIEEKYVEIAVKRLAQDNLFTEVA